MRNCGNVAAWSVAGAALVGVLACGGGRGAAKPVAPAVDAAVVEVPAWLLPDDACPAEAVGLTAAPSEPFAELCAAGLDGCLARCQGDDATACYAAALEVQAEGGRPRLEGALFLRACALGHASGCTNRAAALATSVTSTPEEDACAARTFEISCARRDPWGCTMLGRGLAEGLGVDRDVERARAVLPRACEADQADPACEAARALLHDLEASPP